MAGEDIRVDPPGVGASDAPTEANSVVFVLGTFIHEGLTAKAKSLGFTLIPRQLRSTEKNWRDIAAQLKGLNDENRLAAVFVYLPSPALLHVANPAFDAVRPALFDQLERTKTSIFVYEDNLEGSVEPFPWDLDGLNYGSSYTVAGSDEVWDAAFGELQDLVVGTRQQLRAYRSATRTEWLVQNKDLISRALALLEEWSDRNVEVLPFRKRADVTIRMFEALDDVGAGVFLRLYIPNRRYQSEQFEDFLALFNRFLREVEGKDFAIDVERTTNGTTYVFKGNKDSNTLEDLRAAASRFDAFLLEAREDAKSVESRLISHGSSPTEAPFIVAKYLRKVTRLMLEAKHEFEIRHLVLVQQAETELLEAGEQRLIPQVREDRPSTLFSIVGNVAPVTVNLSASPISMASAVAIGGLAGSISYSVEDGAILERIDALDDRLQVLKLRSELERLKDPATSPDQKITAVQKLKGFLYSSTRYVGRKVDKIGTDVLVAYLERQLPGGPS